jgi:hypothetical protein
VADLIAGDEALAALVPTETAHREVLHAFENLRLTPPLAFKLTVMREQCPNVWSHSVQVALIAASLARVDRIAEGDVSDAAMAGLLHDLGLLHIAPEVFAPDTTLDHERRLHLYTHPVIAQVMLTAMPTIDRSIIAGIVQHHEREDGSGYPRGLRAAHISPLGKLLAVAEVAAAVLTTRSVMSVAEMLSVVLRLNRRKLATPLISTVLKLLGGVTIAAAEPPPRDMGRSLDAMLRLATAVQSWDAVPASLHSNPLVALARERMAGLEHSLAGAGIDLRNWTMIGTDLDTDPIARAELQVVATEGAWQLDALVHEIERRRQSATNVPGELDLWLRQVGAESVG